MKEHLKNLHSTLFKTTLGILVSILTLVLVAQFFWSYRLTQQVLSLTNHASTTTNTLGNLEERLEAQQDTQESATLLITDELYNTQKHLDDLVDLLEDFEGDVDKLSGSVETLEKLTTTDPQLLQKYSRIYFLNENYIPTDLAQLEEKYDYINGKEVVVHAEMLPFLEDLLEEAEDDGVSLQVLSGYRSFAEQTTLKERYLTQYGAGANSFSADQGYSEHQLGTAVDFTTPEVGEQLSLFENTDAFRWLMRHAYKYGFVLSYPENNAYYVYEPWHWRFVGKDLARYLDRNNKYLYDLEQRVLDTYIATIFDK